MKLVIMELRYEAVGNSSWAVFHVAEDMLPAMELMGHKVIEVTEEKGNELLKSMREALSLQLQLRQYCYPNGQPKSYGI